MRKWGQFQSFLEQAKFYAEWNNYSYAARNGVFKVTHQKVYLSVKCVNKSIYSYNGNFSSMKPQQIFQFF